LYFENLATKYCLKVLELNRQITLKNVNIDNKINDNMEGNIKIMEISCEDVN
jgi:hypothetical protein